jgi:peptide/nickel transport system ATP-binding protein
MSEPILSVRDLRVWYATEGEPARAVDGVSLDIRPG